MRGRTLSAITALGLLVATAPARASEIEGAVQLGLITPVIGYSKVSAEIEGPLASVDLDVSSFAWGLTQNPVILQISYGVSRSVTVGGFAQLGGTSVSTEVDLLDSEEQEQTSFGLLIGPKLDLVFSPGASTRPFLTAGGGLVMNRSEDSAEQETSSTGFLLLGGGGLRAFLAPGFSLDPQLLFTYSMVSGETEIASTELDISGSQFTVMAAIGFSGWIL